VRSQDSLLSPGDGLLWRVECDRSDCIKLRTENPDVPSERGTQNLGGLNAPVLYNTRLMVARVFLNKSVGLRNGPGCAF
jgi:hypothetical protein